MNKEARTEWLNGLKENDTVYYRYMHREQDLRVEKVGHKFIHLQGGKKINKLTGVAVNANGSGSAGMIHASKEVFDAGAKRNTEWQDLMRDVRNINGRPSHLSDADVETIRNLLFPQS